MSAKGNKHAHFLLMFATNLCQKLHLTMVLFNMSSDVLKVAVRVINVFALNKCIFFFEIKKEEPYDYKRENRLYCLGAKA